MTHYTEEELILHHYGESRDPEAVRRHLESCDRCRREHDVLLATFAAVDSLEVPERDAAYPRRVLRRVEGELARPPRASLWGLWSLFTPARVASVAAVAALVALAFLAGQRQGQSELSDEARQRLLMAAVGDHLQSSERMLIELSNADASRGLNLSSQRRRAEMLASANRLYRRTAQDRGQADVAQLLDQLERVLLEIANSEERLTPAEFNALWLRVEKQGLLIKMRIVEAQARRQRTRNEI